MPASTSGRQLAATLTVVVFTGAVVAVGLVAGFGIWFAAALTGGLLGALGTLLVIGLTGRSSATVPLSGVDPTTGLPGADRLGTDLERELSVGFGAALHVCSLHGLGEYNRAYGDACGDAMVGWLARKLRDAVGDQGTVYRLRGASFAVLTDLGGGVDDLSSACAGALLEVGDGFMIRGTVGRALAPEEAETPAAALELATRRALGARQTQPGESELRAPQDPLEVRPLERPRYQVAEVAARIGRRMGLDGAALEDLEAAAHLRDVGNMALPTAVLTRSGELPGYEWEFIRLHTVVGERLLAANFGMESVGRLVRSSHERWDGGGYPDGLSGAQIPLGARILFVCAAFQDMTSERPHRPAREAREALSELARGAGSQFDPDVVAAFQLEFAPPQEPAARVLGTGSRRPLTVLVADDDAASRFLLARAIDAAGQHCTVAEDGLAAWRAFRRHRPDVVICDARLPKLPADRLCRRIRTEEGERQTYFVTLVALAEGERIQRDPDTGADDFLAKPFDREDLQTLLAVAAGEVSLRRQAQGRE
jgi:response regulator RpfG family c-di-GMP phosphodiesterase/GGDEF domain-containing protein